MTPPASFESAGASAWPVAPTCVLAKNNSSAAVGIGRPLAVTGPLVSPGLGASALAAFRESVAVIGDVPEAVHVRHNLFGIAVEPIAAGKVGRIAVGGVVAAVIDVQNTDDWAVRLVEGQTKLQTSKFGSVPLLWKHSGTGDQWAIVRMAGGGQPSSVRLAKTTGTWNKGDTANVTIWDGGEEEEAGETLVDVVNKYVDIGSGKWCHVAQAANGTWYVIAAEC